MGPNLLAWIALAAWPLVALATFAARRSRGSAARTVAWMLFLPVMFLPNILVLKVPGVPAFDKYRIGLLSVALGLVLFHPEVLARAQRSWRFPAGVFVFLLVGVVQTVRTNGDPLSFGRVVLPGLGSKDAVNYAASLFLDLYLPFVLGQAVFRTQRDVRDLLDVLGRCAMVYVPFVLVELRFSPQLHRWTYGYHQHGFIQTLRGSGFRPMAYMAHGLHLTVFLFTGYLASLSLVPLRAPLRPSAKVRAGILAALLLACRSFGAVLYAAAATPIQWLLSEKAKLRVALLLAAIVVAYPVIRTEQLVSARSAVELIQRVNPERAWSLAFRFGSEDLLLAHARERPLFGWGGWDRNQLFDPWGSRRTTADGTWVILLGIYGYVGWGGFFALLLFPIVLFARRRALLPPAGQLLGSTLALIIAFFGVDFLPNSQWDYLPVVYAGALFAYCDHARTTALIRRRRRPRPAPRLEERPAIEVVPSSRSVA